MSADTSIDIATDKIEALCEYLNNHAAERYPIANAALAASEDSLKNGYLEMLAVLLQQRGAISEAQQAMFARLVAGAMDGAKVAKSAQDYLNAALEIKVDDYLQFAAACQESDLRFRWVLDALVVTCVKERSEEQVVLIAQVCESLKITKEELTYIAAGAKAIVELNAAAYADSASCKAESVPDTIFVDYFFLLSDDCMFAGEGWTVFQPIRQEDVTAQILDKLKNVETPCVKIVGATFEGKNPLSFADKEKVMLDGCHFKGGGGQAVTFNQCQDVVARNCEFADFTSRTLYLDGVNSLLVKGCEFNNCCYHYDAANLRDDMGVLGCVFAGSAANFLLADSSFSSCGGCNHNATQNWARSAFISSVDCLANNCAFKNCDHKSAIWGCQLSGCNSSRNTMFTPNSRCTNCTFENSVKFN